MVRIFIAIFFISCQHNSKSLIDLARMDVNIDDSDIKSITVDSSNAIILSEKEAKEVMDFGMFIDSIEYIPLETRNDILIGEINRMALHNDRFYLLDKYTAKAIFIFDKTGKHINTISAFGRGPNEYISPKSISVDKFNNELILVDSNDYSLLYYDLDGNFKRKEQCGIRFSDVLRITKEDFLIYTGTYWNIHKPEIDKYRIAIGNPSGQLKWRGLFKDEFYYNLDNVGHKHVHEYGQNILITPPYTNTIIQINSDGSSLLRYQFIFENGNPDLYRNINITNFSSELASTNAMFFDGNLAETDDHLLAMIGKSGQVLFFIYDKHLNKSFIATYLVTSGRILGDMTPLFTKGHSIYSIVTPYRIHSMNNLAKGETGIAHKNWQLPKALENVKEDDNPVIVRYTLSCQMINK